jgi:hypothetical protein
MADIVITCNLYKHFLRLLQTKMYKRKHFIPNLRIVFLILFYIILISLAFLCEKKIILVDPQEILGWDLHDFYIAALEPRNPYTSSKFVTPPLSLLPSKLLTLFEFSLATKIWIVFNITFLMAGLWLASRQLKNKFSYFLILLFASLSFPTHMLL